MARVPGFDEFLRHRARPRKLNKFESALVADLARMKLHGALHYAEQINTAKKLLRDAA